MPEITLSICIPTFNFGNVIGETLSGIVEQLVDGVEVVVLDGASTDDTAAVVRSIQDSGANIRYHRLAERGGIDRDMARVVDLAFGTYCWLFSGDDLMRVGGLDRVLDVIKSGHDIYLCKHTMCTFEMKVLSERAVLDSPVEAQFDLANDAERDRYFAMARTSEAFFSFMGSIIVKRSKWSAVQLNDAFIGSCWAHVARMFELMPTGLRLRYLPEALLDRRGDNDSFADRGVVNRYRIAIDGYHRLADVFLRSNSECAYHVRRVIRKEFGLRMFLHAKLRCWQDPQREDRKLLMALIKKTYCDVPLVGFVLAFTCSVVPAGLYFELREAYRWLRRHA